MPKKHSNNGQFSPIFLSRVPPPTQRKEVATPREAPSYIQVQGVDFSSKPKRIPWVFPLSSSSGK